MKLIVQGVGVWVLVGTGEPVGVVVYVNVGVRVLAIVGVLVGVRVRFGVGEGVIHGPPYCIVSVWSGLLALTAYPAVHAWFGITATAWSSRVDVPGLGLGTTSHWLPSQCSLNEPPNRAPTAQTSFEEAADTPRNGPSPPGAGTTLHCVPSQCSVSTFPPEVLP